jgi:hypothetical protein
MTDLASALKRLVVGDIFHGRCPNGASLICLVESTTDDRIQARRITTQCRLEFDRSTGATLGREIPCLIDSIAPLPVEIHNLMLGLDRKMRLEHDSERFKLSKGEKDALRFVASHYASNLLSRLLQEADAI